MDETGTVVTYHEFDPYGNPVAGEGDLYGYTGEWWEEAVGLLHLRARWYAPETGTFLSVDPVESEPPYQYVRGNVINLTDPSGITSPSPTGTLPPRPAPEPVTPMGTPTPDPCDNGSCKIEVQMRNIGVATGWSAYHAAIIFTDAENFQTKHSAYPSDADESEVFKLVKIGTLSPGFPVPTMTPPPD